MRKRAAALARLKKQHAQMLDLANAKVVRAERELKALQNAYDEMNETMSGEFGNYGPIAAIASIRLRNVERALAKLANERESGKADALRRAGRAKLADRACSAAEDELRARTEKIELMDQIEQALLPRKTSSA